MFQYKNSRWILIIFLIMSFSLSGCRLFAGSEPDLLLSPTSTPTDDGGSAIFETATPLHPCEGLDGMIEMQILVGPSEAVGLAPVSVGQIPFDVQKEGGLYMVNGGGPLEYYQEVLELEKGTYTVTFEGDTTVSGECVWSEVSCVLNLIVEFAGEQLVEVEAEGFQGAYPWSGANTMEVALPIVDGASQQGEGWILELHLDN